MTLKTMPENDIKFSINHHLCYIPLLENHQHVGTSGMTKRFGGTQNPPQKLGSTTLQNTDCLAKAYARLWSCCRTWLKVRRKNKRICFATLSWEWSIADRKKSSFSNLTMGVRIYGDKMHVDEGTQPPGCRPLTLSMFIYTKAGILLTGAHFM